MTIVLPDPIRTQWPVVAVDIKEVSVRVKQGQILRCSVVSDRLLNGFVTLILLQRFALTTGHLARSARAPVKQQPRTATR
jgi:hypothetical protein